MPIGGTLPSSAPPRVKVCCISTVAEAALAIAHGAAALGLVSHMPSGPGVVDEAHIAEIIATVPPPIATFLLTSAVTAEAIIAQQQRMRPTTLQLVDHLGAEVHQALRIALPGITLVQVVHVEDEDSVAYALTVAPTVDALLLDSGRLNAPVKELGGTGGLNTGNVAEAIRTVRPYGLDLCTGVRTNGALDPLKLEHFMRAVRAA
jgi:phosphoribosylanthranilate isomerase